jgi:mannitol 2-dehydrogenase
VSVPRYDRTRLAPRIAHVGVGGFHRAHLAVYAHDLAAAGGDWGIVGLGLLAPDATMAEVLRAQDNLYTVIEKGNAEPTARVIGSIVDFVFAPHGHDAALADVVAASTTAILSLTVTEAGYQESPTDGSPGATATFDRLAGALSARRAGAAGPLTILSCDNLPGNGDAARRATLAAAARVDGRLAEWIDRNCTFPNSMVDRITPATTDADRAWLSDRVGIDDRWPVVCEPFRQWVMEDDFTAGRPAWHTAGALFTDRIHDWERYKLRLLNATHSCLAYVAALAEIEFVHEAMETPAIRGYLEQWLGHEAIPTLTEIPGHPRERYAASVLERFANAGVEDQIARICVDGTAKFAAFVVPTIVDQLQREGSIDHAATALAAWAHYLVAIEPAAQAVDSNVAAARRYATEALADPAAFLEFEAVFVPALHGSPRFRAAFVAAYRRIAEHGPIEALACEIPRPGVHNGG